MVAPAVGSGVLIVQTTVVLPAAKTPAAQVSRALALKPASTVLVLMSPVKTKVAAVMWLPSADRV